MKLCNKTISILLFSACTGTANAAFVDYGSYSTDSLTGLDWLDITATAGLSYNSVKGGAGGWTASGWRYARSYEVADLMGRYVGSGSEAFYAGSPYTNALGLIRQLGVSVSFNNAEGIQQIYGANYPVQISVDGYFDDGSDNGQVGLSEVAAIMMVSSPLGNPELSSRWVVYDDFWTGNSSAGLGFGSFLVRESGSVPEPTSLALIAAAVLGAAVTRKRRQVAPTV